MCVFFFSPKTSNTCFVCLCFFLFISLSFSLEGNDPRSSAGFQLIQQHALEHSSMEFSDDESLVNALAGSFNTSEDFRRVGRWAEGVCRGTRLDPDRLRNLRQVWAL